MNTGTEAAAVELSAVLLRRAEAKFQLVAVSPEWAELSDAFVSLWNSSVGGPEYDKKQWIAFWGLLLQRGVVR